MSQSPILDYADVPNRWGVVCQFHDGMMRVVVPPLPSWRHLSKGFLVGGAVLAVVVVVISYNVVVGSVTDGVGALIAYGGGLFAVALSAISPAPATHLRARRSAARRS